MLEKVKRYAEKWQMLTNEDCVIVGVSGGADSICLLLILLELQKEIGFKVVAVHVNHRLRGKEADDDETFVRNFCESRNVICEIYSADVESIAKKRKQSTEEAGREVRKEFFEETRKKYNGTKIALAHHKNDNAETVLLHLARGTGIKGLGGIAPVNGVFIRPLLCVEREEIERYLDAHNISYCIDETNQSDEYTRNRIRNHVLPYMEKELNSKTVDHISETAQQMRKVQEYLEEQTKAYFDECVIEKQLGFFVTEKEFEKIPDVLKPLLLKSVLAKVAGKEKDLEAIHLKQLQDLFDKQVGKKIDLPYQMEGCRVYAGIEICLKDKEQNEIPEEVVVDLQEGQTQYIWGEQKIRCCVRNKLQTDGETLEKNHTKRFDCDIIKDVVSFRTRREGDYITIHPDGRTQKLKSFFINEKIPLKDRDRILLLADGNHVMWIVGYRVNCAYQINENTRCVLEVHMDKGEKNGGNN